MSSATAQARGTRVDVLLTLLFISTSPLRAVLAQQQQGTPEPTEAGALLASSNSSTSAACGVGASAEDDGAVLVRWKESFVRTVDGSPVRRWGGGGAGEEEEGGVCGWGGVACEVVEGNRQRITGLSVGLAGAEAPIPAELSCLVELVYLELNGIELTGELPEGWSTLTRLRVLNLNLSMLRGTLPPAWSTMRGVEDMRLRDSALTGPVPMEWATELTQLQFIDLGASLTGALPVEWIANCRRLKLLNLDGNRFTGQLPAQWSAFSTLHDLHLSHTTLSGSLPPQWSALGGSLHRLAMPMASKLTGGLPVEWSTMSLLQELRLTEASLANATLPNSWSAMTALLAMQVEKNGLRGGLPASFSTLRSLEYLGLRGNALSGSLPCGWGGAMTALRELSLKQNQMSGALCPEWSRMSALQVLELDGNRLKGTLPPAWSALNDLQDLDIAFNRMSGTIPDAWLRLPSLEKLRLKVNNISGTLPAAGDLSGLVLSELRLDSNHISGTIPAEMSEMLTLTELSLTHNRLTGSVPPEFSRLVFMRSLHLGGNLLEGGTSWADNLRQLTSLSLCAPPLPPLAPNATRPPVAPLPGEALGSEVSGNQFCGAPPLLLSQAVSAVGGVSADPLPSSSFPQPGNRDDLPGRPGPGASHGVFLGGLLRSAYFGDSDDDSDDKKGGGGKKGDGGPGGPDGPGGGGPGIDDRPPDLSCFTSVECSATPAPTPTPPSNELTSSISPDLSAESTSSDSVLLAAAVSSASAAVVVTVLGAAVAFLVCGRRRKAAVGHGGDPEGSAGFNDLSGIPYAVQGSSTATTVSGVSFSLAGAVGPSKQPRDGIEMTEFEHMASRRVLHPNQLSRWQGELARAKSLPGAGLVGSTRAYSPLESELDYSEAESVSSVQRVKSSFAVMDTTRRNSARTNNGDGLSPNGDFAAVDLDVSYERDIKPYLSLKLGSGAFGDVYLGKFRGRKVAVKLLSRAFQGASTAQYRSFQQEVELLSGMPLNERIVRIHGACLTPPHVCIVYELLPTSLYGRMRLRTEPPLSYLQILRIARDVAEGLSVLHPGIIHRDLKPQNVLLDGAGRAKLIDFGLSRAKTALESYVMTDTGGTPGYMSPEVFDGRGRINELSDIYSLAVLMCEMLSGADSIWSSYCHAAQIVVAVVSRGERPAIPLTCPDNMRTLIQRCWAQDARERLSAAEVVAELDGIIEAEEGKGGHGGDEVVGAVEGGASVGPAPAEPRPASWACSFGVYSS